MIRRSQILAMTIACLIGLISTGEAKAEDQVYSWTKTFGGAGEIVGYSVATDGNGHVYIGGILQNSADFDPSDSVDIRTSSGSYDGFVSKFDTSGNYLWTRIIGGTGDDRLMSVALDITGNIYVGGSFRGTVDFDPGIGSDIRTSTGGDDIFLVKFDASGNYQWSRTLGGAGNDRAMSVDVDAMENLYISGRFQNVVDFDPGVSNDTRTSSGSNDFFFSKYDALGTYQWTRALGGTGSDGGSAVKVDASGNIYVGGFFSNTVDFDPGAGTVVRTSSGSWDAFLSKYSASGSHEWTEAIGGDLEMMQPHH